MQCKAYCFNFEAKQWKPLPSVAQLEKATKPCFCAERIGNYLFLAGKNKKIHRYDVVNNSWVKLPEYRNNHEVNCLCSVGDYLYAISESNPPQRYSLTNTSWQGGEGLKVGGNKEKLSTVSATVMNSKIYVIHSYQINESEGRKPSWVNKPAVVHFFDPKYNVWKKLASTCHPHFESSCDACDERGNFEGRRYACFLSVADVGTILPVVMKPRKPR